MEMATNEQVIQAQLAATTAPYEAQLSNLRAEYDASREKQARENAKRLNELYIMSEQNKRTLPQQLAVQGMNGGLTESSMVNLANTYMNNRNAQNQAYQDNLADLTLAYNQNVNDINAKIAAARAQADAERAALAAEQEATNKSNRYSGGGSTSNARNSYGPYQYGTVTSMPKNSTIVYSAPGSMYSALKNVNNASYFGEPGKTSVKYTGGR